MSAARWAWALAAFSAALMVLDTVLVALSTPMFSTEAIGIHGWPLTNAASLGSAIIGAVIISADPRQPIGWLLNIVGATTSLSLTTESYGVWVLEHGGHGTTEQGQVANWVASVLGGPMALTVLTIVFLLVPNGHYLAPGWRWVARAACLGYASYVVGLLRVGLHGINQRGEAIETDLVTDILLSGGVIVITLAILAAVASMLLRLRGSTGEVRQQLRVVTIGAASIGVALIILIIAQSFSGGEQLWWSSIPLSVSYAFLLGCIAVAVLRYRLYDVEVIVSRALVVAMAAGFAALGYIGLVVALGQSVGDRTDGGFWLSLLVTAGVALAFQPLRRWVVRLADRLAYGNRAAPYDALADFSRRIGHSPAPGTLLPTIAAAAGETVQAERAVVRLDVDGGTDFTAEWPSPSKGASGDLRGEPDLVIPVEDRNGQLGSIELDLPPGRGVRALERRLLHDIADQAALAFRNARLQVELAARVEQLDQRAHELTASRNRIIGAADTERRRLESAIARQVLPTMAALRTELETCSRSGMDAVDVGRFVGEASQALESLRELTRGIYPTLLTRSGLGPALTSYAARAQRPEVITIDPDVAKTRYAERVEAAAYFCCVEAISQTGDGLGIDVGHKDGTLVLTVHGVDLTALDRLAVVDRVEACEGTLEVVQQYAQTALRISLPATVPAGSPA